MRLIHSLTLFHVTVLSACASSSLEVPLPSFHVTRPYAGRKEIAGIVGGGLVQAPEVQGMTDAVHDADGNEINSVPDYLGESPLFFTHGDYSSKTLFDLGINLKKRLDIGWSSTRGVYAFLNVLEWNAFTLALSPAYYNATQLNRDRSSSLEDGPKKYGAQIFDRSLTAIGSVFLGSRGSAGFVFYGGYGHHRLGLQIKDYRSNESASTDADGRTLLAGFGIDSNFGSLYIEEAWTSLPQRTGDTPKARSFAAGGSFQFGN